MADTNSNRRNTTRDARLNPWRSIVTSFHSIFQYIFRCLELKEAGAKRGLTLPLVPAIVLFSARLA